MSKNDDWEELRNVNSFRNFGWNLRLEPGNVVIGMTFLCFVGLALGKAQDAAFVIAGVLGVVFWLLVRVHEKERTPSPIREPSSRKVRSTEETG